MKLMNHPNIIKLHEIYEGDGHVYLVEDLLKGGELFEKIISKGNFTEQESAALITQLLRALEYINRMNIMHRDIKPENLIFRDEDGLELVLADFGLAEFANQNEFMFRKCGTPGYVAPEVLEDKDYDMKCDMFSAGCILYILLSGCSPFYGISYHEIVAKNKKGKVSWDFEKVNIKLSDKAMDLLRKMLEIDSQKRISVFEALNHPWIQKYLNYTNKISPLQSPLKPVLNIERPLLNLKQLLANEKKPSDILFNSPLLKGRVEGLDMCHEMESPLGKNSGSAFKKNSQVKNSIINPIKCEKKTDSINEIEEMKLN